jgi:hypothetical protein
MAAMAVDVVGYCLPGRDVDLKNTCMFMPKVLHSPVVVVHARLFTDISRRLTLL